MRRILVYGIFIILATSFIIGCNKIDNPVIEIPVYTEDLYGPAPVFTPNELPDQHVLLEDFTGHECGNCPGAHQKAKEILIADSEHIAVVAIHAGSLAAPYPPLYPDDFTTPEGTYYLLTQVGADVMPKGRVNRRPDASVVSNYSAWSTQVDEALQQTPAANMQLITDFEVAAGKLVIHVFSNWLEDFSGDVRLIVLVTENEIVSSQLNYSVSPVYTDTAYQHEHVLRGSATGATGLIAYTNPKAGDFKTNSYIMNWNPSWVPENCEVIAFLTNGIDGEVINVAKSKVIP